MRISKTVREAAIVRALVEAEAHRRGISHEESPLETNLAARRLLSDAYEAVWGTIGYDQSIADDALEAAALLEDGWSPGDLVERLS